MLPEKMNVLGVQVDTKIYVKNESNKLLLLIDYQMKAIVFIIHKSKLWLCIRKHCYIQMWAGYTIVYFYPVIS